MKKLILISVSIFLLIGIVFAGTQLSRTNSSISISQDRLNKIGIAISVNAEPIKCDDNECWANVKQDNVIQTEFRIPKKYCYKENKNESCSEYEKVCNEYEQVCSSYEQVCENDSCSNGNCLEYVNGNCLSESQGNCTRLVSNPYCEEYRDYTAEELINFRNEFIKHKLEKYADSINTKEVTKIDDGGIVTTK